MTDDEIGDISAQAFWATPFEEREKTFAWLRENEPVSWHRPYESTLLPPDDDTPGFWAITKHEHLKEVSRDSDTFISGRGHMMEDFPPEAHKAYHSFLSMDDPEHNRLRSIVSRSFTPRNVREMEGWINDTAREIVDEVIDKGEGDFCTLVSKELPGRIFAHFMGLPDGSDEQEVVMDAAEKMLAWDDPQAAAGRDAITTHTQEADRIQEVALAQAEKARKDPGDNMITWVVQAEADGKKMEDWEIASFFSLLGSAANDTTRHTMAHGVRLLSQHPDQLEAVREDWDGRINDAIEEILRYGSTVMHFRRTAIKDTEVGGVEIKDGEKVVLWYSSGNYDEDVFTDSHTFDVSRKNAKEHMAFGAGGNHFCIGSHLGKQMVKAGLTEVYSRMPDITLDGEPTFQQNNFLNGIHALPVRWTPPKD